jgi:uncharacterized protein
MSEPESAKPVRRAVLIFADALAKDLSRRGWSRKLSGLLNVPTIDAAKVDADVHVFGPRRQRGANFGERLSNAVEDLAQLDYDQIVIVGRDCPDLTCADIEDAFSHLPTSRAVLGPDHRGGCYLIGIHASDRALLADIRWQQDTDFAEIAGRFGADHVAVLAMKIDLDSSEDLRLLNWSLDLLPESITPCIDGIAPARVHVLQRWQLPPPSILSSLRAA